MQVNPTDDMRLRPADASGALTVVASLTAEQRTLVPKYRLPSTGIRVHGGGRRKTSGMAHKHPYHGPARANPAEILGQHQLSFTNGKG